MGITERKQREKEQRKQHIIEVAEMIFVEKSINATTMDDIANACELSKGTLYLYFKSKEELFFHIMLNIMSSFINMVEENLAKQTNYEQRINSLGESYLQFYREFPIRFHIMNYQECHPERKSAFSDIQQEQFQIFGRIWQIVENVIQEGIDKGIFVKQCNPIEIGIMLWASSNGMIKIMEHIKTSHSFLPNQSEHDKHFKICDFYETDYERMLRNLWLSIINSIRTKPNYQQEQL